MTPIAQPEAAPEAATKAATLSPKVIEQLLQVPILASLTPERLHCLDGATSLHLDRDQILIKQGELVRQFYITLEGSLRLTNTGPTGIELPVYEAHQGWAFGEVPLLSNIPSGATVQATEDCEILVLDEEQFWHLMTECPEVRKAILGNMAMRLAKYQSTTFHQEKMAVLGTMAAGLMHELNNPGSAARRASSQLRENLRRLHELGGRFTGVSFTEDQKECLYSLQEYALTNKPPVALSSLEQADAEEALSEWLKSADIPDAWKLSPTLVAVGLRASDLECARGEFETQVFSDALNWLEALVSSQQLVGTIEESITRITELVSAVKSYAWEGKGMQVAIDVKQSIHATMVILAHKFREKQVVLEKNFGTGLPLLAPTCQGINQVWTNLLDNAIDAVPQGGRIRVKTWAETSSTTPPRAEICILIGDNGPGIPTECQAQIFDPFFTTKPVGVGTGLGLGIVYRIVEQCGGSIHFSSVPENTEFLVRLPAQG